MHRPLRPLLPVDSEPRMSGNSHHTKETRPAALREAHRACDYCRTRKSQYDWIKRVIISKLELFVQVRCDGPEQPDKHCTTCNKRCKACTYTNTVQRRAIPSTEYVRGLEERLATVERLVRKQRPDVDLLRELGALTLAADGIDAVPNMSDDASSDDEDMLTNFYSTGERDEPSQVLLGKSSILPLIRTAIGSSTEPNSSLTTEDESQASFARRPEFWQPPYYEARMDELGARESSHRMPLMLPPEETMRPLIDRFFDEHNFFYPLLQRRLFEQQLALEARGERFNAIVLLVCASGARLGMNVAAERAGQPPGWSYFEQVIPFLNIPVFATAQLEDVQMLILAFIYLSTRVHVFTPWTIFHAALRMVVQVGAHQAKFYQKDSNLVDELWKRAFWVVVVIDRHLMLSMGHSPAILEESYDVAPILEVDDDCWDLSNPAAGYPLLHPQPQDKPSLISFFNYLAKLHQMIGTTIRSVYSINRSRVLMGFLGDEWERKVVGKLDKLLEQWRQSVPSHLCWDPDHLNEWTVQAAALRTSYLHAQIIIHNPFSFARPSLSRSQVTNSVQGSHADAMALCTAAAHDSAAVFATQLAHGIPIFIAQMGCAIHSSLVLLLNTWSIQTGPFNTGFHHAEERKRVERDLKTCMDVVKHIESARGTIRSWNFLNELASLPDEPREGTDRGNSDISMSDQLTLSRNSALQHALKSGSSPPPVLVTPTRGINDPRGISNDLPQDIQMILQSGSYEMSH